MKQLTQIDKAFLLKKTSLFASLDADLLLTLSDKFECETYKKGTKIFEIDQESGKIYLLVEGTVLISNRQGSPLAELRTLEIFGDEGVLSEKRRGYDAFCQTDALLLTLSQSHLLAILGECPTVAIHLLETYAANVDFRKR
jgi:CRP/FNR family cyclic AMP-dependent transcriptional regulator